MCYRTIVNDRSKPRVLPELKEEVLVAAAPPDVSDWRTGQPVHPPRPGKASSWSRRCPPGTEWIHVAEQESGLVKARSANASEGSTSPACSSLEERRQHVYFTGLRLGINKVCVQLWLWPSSCGKRFLASIADRITLGWENPWSAANMTTSYTNSWWKQSLLSPNSAHWKWPLSIWTPASLWKHKICTVVHEVFSKQTVWTDLHKLTTADLAASTF